MDNSIQQVFGRIAEALSQDWEQDDGETISDFSKFSGKQIQGQGATSNNYLIQFAVDQGGSRSFFVKQYTADTTAGRRQLDTDYRTAKWLAAELGEQSTLCVDNPVLMLPEDRVLVTTYVSGENLSPYFFKKLRWHFLSKNDVSDLESIAGKIGSGLADLQNIPVDSAGPFFEKCEPERIFDGFKVELEGFLNFYSARDICPNPVRKVISQLEDCLEEYLFNEPAYCFQHNDYILQNFILEDNGELHLFDFANSTIGIPYFDMAHLINSLEDLTYLKTVSEPLVDQLKLTFLQPFINDRSFQPKLLAAIRAYIQLYSGMIILSGKDVAKKTLLRHVFKVNPEKRLEMKLLTLLKEIES